MNFPVIKEINIKTRAKENEKYIPFLKKFQYYVRIV
jgi:hypothetical protein